MQQLFRHSEKFIQDRLARLPAERHPAKRLELELAGLITGVGISNGEALRVAEECARDPLALAIRLHQISNEYLHARTPSPYSAVPRPDPIAAQLDEVIQQIDGGLIGPEPKP